MTRPGKEKDVEQPEIVSKVQSDPYGSVHDSISQDISTVRLSRGISRKANRLELRMVVVKPRSREDSVSERLCSVWLGHNHGSSKSTHESQGQSVGKPTRWAWAILGLCVSRPGTDQELRMVVVKPRSRKDSVSERLCSVWLDNIREELVIVYETVNKLCIGSHVSK
ncbi:hypothetical protein Bca4012_020380 [Brassica carinata]|uniref:Uncharacterized protein n=1 Tax=Brassica carinata TaxID=52824 RepID=A0A8X7WJ12_BRACI|nr:hypothetical protein Bca52824_001245 [Brassica carinata]